MSLIDQPYSWYSRPKGRAYPRCAFRSMDSLPATVALAPACARGEPTPPRTAPPATSASPQWPRLVPQAGAWGDSRRIDRSRAPRRSRTPGFVQPLRSLSRRAVDHGRHHPDRAVDRPLDSLHHTGIHSGTRLDRSLAAHDCRQRRQLGALARADVVRQSRPGLETPIAGARARLRRDGAPPPSVSDPRMCIPASATCRDAMLLDGESSRAPRASSLATGDTTPSLRLRFARFPRSLRPPCPRATTGSTHRRRHDSEPASPERHHSMASDGETPIPPAGGWRMRDTPADQVRGGIACVLAGVGPARACRPRSPRSCTASRAACGNWTTRCRSCRP